MSLKVIGAGLGRTGTASLKVALETLGFGKCHHMSEVFGSPQQVDLWTKAADGAPDWPATFDGYGAAVDFPTAAFWRELAAFYPDAKIILSVRDAEKWWQSTQETILSPLAVKSMPGMPFGPVVKNVVWRFFDNEIHDHDHLTAAFNRHTEEVKKAIPKERLLVFEAKDGWAPLCEFLGKDIPSEAYPRVNSKEEMRPMMEAMAAQFEAGLSAEELNKMNQTVRDTVHGRKS
ncbi:sulfotransferase family protein [Hyphococcus sp.]|uniref:sulfotransferase family protein n=1 Tax=Hyphococcus sp. TaxID=2038636 RepID=UPI002081BA8C|nr:MAG: sulfotransferase family protein [Marinicaulis sp.]